MVARPGLQGAHPLDNANKSVHSTARAAHAGIFHDQQDENAGQGQGGPRACQAGEGRASQEKAPQESRPAEPAGGALDDAVRDAALRPRARRAFPAGDRAGLCDNLEEIAAIAGNRAEPTFANTIDALERSGRLSTGCRACSSTCPAPTLRRISRPSSARWRRAMPSTAWHLPERQAVRARRRPDAGGKDARPDAGADAGARALPPRLRQGRRRRSTRRPRRAWPRSPSASPTLGTQFGQNVLADEQAYLLVLEGEADLAGLPEPCSPRPRSGRRARQKGQARDHAVALEHRAVPAVLDAPRSAREGLQGLDQARRQWRRDRQPRDHRRDPEPADRARKAAGLQDAGRLALDTRWPRRPSRAPAADGRVGAGAQARALEERDAAAGGRAGRRRQLQTRRLGLALLRRESAQGRASISTRPRSSPTFRSTA